jgi:hypothetical protein
MVAGAGLTLRTEWRQSRYERVRLGTPGSAPGDSSGQHWSATDPWAWRPTCANAVTLDPAGPHAVYGMQGVRGFKSPQLHQAQRIGRSPARGRCQIRQSLTSRVRRNTLSAGRFGGFEAFHDESCPEDFYSASTPATGHLPHPHTRVDPKESRRPPRQRVGNGPGIGNAQRNSGLRTGWEIGADDRCRGHADTSGDHRDHHHCDDLPVVVVARV